MDNIPAEVLANIIECFPEEQKYIGSTQAMTWSAQLAPYAAISRAWKASVERVAFKDLTVASNELDAFGALFSGDNISRRAYLASLTIVFILPNPENALGCCPVVRTLDRTADSVAFSASVAKVFTILADLAASATEHPPLYLSFYSAYRLSKWKEPKGSSTVPCQPGYDKYQHSRREVLEAKAVSGQFELLCDESLPVLHDVKSFTFKGFDDLDDLKPTWIPAIVGQLPSLERLHLHTKDLYSAGRLGRIKQRERFAASICGLAGTHIREIRLNVTHEKMMNEDSPVHDLVGDTPWSQESWCCMFDHLASFPKLSVLQLMGALVIVPEFFRSIANYQGTPFPALVELQLQFAPETADGRWFYQRDDAALEKSRSDPDYEEFWEMKEQEEEEQENDRGSNGSLDSQDYVRVFEDEPFRTAVVRGNRFRSLPDTATLLPLLLDASRVASCIPHLRQFILKLGNMFEHHSQTDYFLSRIFELWYLKAGMPRSPNNSAGYWTPAVARDGNYLHQNRLYWRVDGWEPWSELQTAWQTIAGPDAKIVFLNEDKWTTVRGNTMFHVYNGDF